VYKIAQGIIDAHFMQSTSSGKSSPGMKQVRQQRSDRTIRVVLLGEDRITRAGVRILIDKEPGMSVVGEHQLVDDPAAVLTSAHPHITLIDVDRSSRDFVPELVARFARKTRVIVLTSTYDTDLVSSAFWAGAKGLVCKDETPTLLLKAIRRVDAGEIWLDRITIARLLGELSRGADSASTEGPGVGRLTLRERQLITVVGQGLGNSEIAERLRISEATVRNHLTSIFKKLELHSRIELVMYALRQGLIKAPISNPPSTATTRRNGRIKNAS
jgi:two-component system, NarL family, nitrate/nitrite response regulator NarL